METIRGWTLFLMRAFGYVCFMYWDKIRFLFPTGLEANLTKELQFNNFPVSIAI